MRRHSKQSGFTLLEMVLVLFIMGLIASMSLVFIDNEDNQLRYLETLQKLEAMQQATITVTNYQGGYFFSGFLADNGVLPATANEYIETPTDWLSYKETYVDNSDPLNPVTKSRFPPVIRTKVVPTANDYYPLVNLNINKGYRGNYISTGYDSNGEYKTGWNNDYIVQHNIASNDFELSYDETLNPALFDAAIDRNITANNWSVPLEDLRVEVVDVTSGFTEHLFIGLIVFENQAFTPTVATPECQNCWKTYYVKKICNSNVKADLDIANYFGTCGANNCFRINSNSNDSDVSDTNGEDGGTDGVSADAVIWQTNNLTAAEEAELDCTAATLQTKLPDHVSAKNTRIPAGEHIVFVGVDENGDEEIKMVDNNGDGVYNDPADESEIKAQAVLKVIPGLTTQPTVTLTLQ